MRRKLTSVLLAMALCLSLATLAFAVGEEETPAPEEQTETLPVEVETPADVVPAPEELSEDEADLMETAVPVVMDHDGVTRVYKEDGTLWYVADPSLTSASPSDRDAEAYEEIFRFIRQMMSEDFEVASEPYEFSHLAGGTDFAPASITPPVKDHDHTMEIIRTDTSYQHDATQHQLLIGLHLVCSDPDCGFFAYNVEPQPPEPHSWTKGSAIGKPTSEGSETHAVKYSYSCVCGATGTATESEAHSLEKIDFGDNYHQGKLHYFEWYLVCSDCGYSTTKWESYSCPGSPSGAGCVLPFKVDPPVETQ